MEIVYRNTPENSVDCLLHAVTTTSNFKDGIKKKKLYAGIVLVIVFMFVLDKALTYQTNAIWWILTCLVFIFFVAYVSAYQIYYIKKCKTKMTKNLVETEHDPKSKRVFRLDDKKVEIGTIERARKYKLTDVKETYDYQKHFCIVMKNGSVVCIPDNYLSAERKAELIEKLDKRYEVEDDGISYDTPF